MRKFLGIAPLLCFSLYALSQQEYDSLKQLLHSPVHDTVQLNLLSQLAEIAPENEWQIYNRQMKALAARNILHYRNDTALRKRLMYRLSEAYFNEVSDAMGKMDLAKAQLYLKQSLTIDLLIGNMEGIAYAQVELAKILTLQGNYEHAIKALYEALRAYEVLRDEKGLANTYVNIGRIYMRQNKPGKAFEFFNKGYKAYELSGYAKGMIDAMDKMAGVYLEQGKIPEALGYMRRITGMVTGIDPKERGPHLDMFYRISGKIYQIEGNKDSALWFYQKGLELVKAEGLIIELSSRHRFMGSAYKDKKEYAKAIYHLNEALRISRATHSLDEEYKSALALYKLYNLTNNHEKALRMHEFYTMMADSIRQREDENHVMQQQFKYEFEKKELLAKVGSEHRISTMRLEAERKNSRKNIWLVIMAACLSLSAGASFFIYKYLRQKHVIASQKANLLKQKLLLSQMNPHFIFNSLNAIQSYIFGQNGMQASIYLSQFAQLMRMILDFSRKEYISLESELEFLKLYMELQQLRIEHKFTYTLVTDEHEEPESILVPPMLAQPFIENAIEHGFFQRKGKGHIIVSIKREGHFLRYSIEDNGIGLETSKKLKDENAKHESLAIRITNERLKTLYSIHNGGPAIHMTDKAVLDNTTSGVRVTFKIPYKELSSTYDQSNHH
jgi:tetratricopeptide (TPR) repeat protein